MQLFHKSFKADPPISGENLVRIYPSSNWIRGESSPWTGHLPIIVTCVHPPNAWEKSHTGTGSAGSLQTESNSHDEKFISVMELNPAM